jgi:hypothetical protein
MTKASWGLSGQSQWDWRGQSKAARGRGHPCYARAYRMQSFKTSPCADAGKSHTMEGITDAAQPQLKGYHTQLVRLRFRADRPGQDPSRVSRRTLPGGSPQQKYGTARTKTGGEAS